MLHFPLCREKMMGMPRTEIVFIWSSALAPFAVFYPLGFTFNTLHDLLKVSVRP